jgi:hypothetical protein
VRPTGSYQFLSSGIFLPVPILWYFPTSSYPLVFSYQFLSSVRPIGSYRATTVAAAILACESGGCGCGRDFIRTKTAWLRLDAAGCLNSTASSYYSGSVRYVSRRGCKSVQFSVFLIPIQVALDYIGKRGSTVGVTREKRIKYAKEILQKEMLPHVGIGEFCETKKAYFFGYIIHRLLLCALGRRAEDDCDHYGNKQLDLAGHDQSVFSEAHKRCTRLPTKGKPFTALCLHLVCQE